MSIIELVSKQNTKIMYMKVVMIAGCTPVGQINEAKNYFSGMINLYFTKINLKCLSFHNTRF